MPCDEIGGIVRVLDTCEQLQAWGLDRLLYMCLCDFKMLKSSAWIS